MSPIPNTYSEPGDFDQPALDISDLPPCEDCDSPRGWLATSNRISSLSGYRTTRSKTFYPCNCDMESIEAERQADKQGMRY